MSGCYEGSQTVNLLFLSGCSPPGNYLFALEVTDNATLEQRISHNVSVFVSEDPYNPNAIFSVPIKIYNNQSIPENAPFIKELSINSNEYSNYENSDLSNVGFFYTNGTILNYSLISGNSASTASLYLMNITETIPAESNIIIYMEFEGLAANIIHPGIADSLEYAQCGTMPVGSSYCVPLKVINTQSSQIASGTQIGIQFAAWAINSLLLNPNVSNICLYDRATGTCLESWMQGNITQGVNGEDLTYPLYDYTDAIWLQAPTNIPAGSDYSDLAIAIFPNSINNYYPSGPMGANPDLYCASGCPSTYYAGADNGADIFITYDNFVGSTLPSNSATIDGNLDFNAQDGGGWYIDNGLVANSSTESDSWITVSTSQTFSAGSDITIDMGVPLTYAYGVEECYYDSCTGAGTETNGQGGFAYLNPDGTFNSLDFLGIEGSDNCGPPCSSYYNVYYDGDTESTILSQGLSSTYNPDMSVTWDGSSGIITQNYGFGNTLMDTSSYNSNTDNFALTRSAYDDGGGTNYAGALQTNYILEREPLPNGQQPITLSAQLECPITAPENSVCPNDIGIGNTLESESLQEPTLSAISGQSYTINAMLPIPDPIQISISNAIDTIVTANSVGGSLTYTVCSTLYDCLPVGTYAVTITDTNTEISTTYPISIYAPPKAMIVQNSLTMDEGQQAYINATVTNGSDIFNYQWYNVTSGNDIAIANQIGPVMLLNATSTGTFKYNVMVTDVGTANAVNSMSNNVIVNIDPYISVNVTPSNEIFSPGSNALVTFNALVTGGTGNYLYQWYNFSSQFFGIPIANQISTNLPVTFNSIGNYSYFLIVTDQGTTTDAYGISTPTNIIVAPAASLTFSSNPIIHGSVANVIASCIPNTDTCAVQAPLGNTLCSGTGSCTYTTPVLAVGNYLYYANDITADMYTSNTFYVDPLCGTTPSGLNVTACIRINIQNTQNAEIASNTQISIPFPANSYMDFEASNMMNVFVYNASSGDAAACWLEGNTLNEGYAQDLYTSENLLYWCRIPDNIPAYSTDEYWYMGITPSSNDLYGNTIAMLGAAPQLYCASGCPTTAYAGADNGNEVFSFYDNFTGPSISGKWYNGNHNGGSITVDHGLTINGGSSSGEYYSISSQGGQGGSGPSWSAATNTFDFLGYFSTFSSRESNVGFWTPSGNPSYITTSGSAYELLVGGATSFSGGSTSSNNIFTSSVNSGTTYGYINYGDQASQGSVPGGDAYPYIDAENDHSVPVITYVQWYRVRTTPPNDIMPTITFSTLNGTVPPVESVAFSSNPITYGSTTNVIASCIPDTDTCAVQSTLGVNLCSGTGTCTYTTSILAVGNYLYYANDITLNRYSSGTLYVLSDCGSTPAGLNVITCIPLSIQNTQGSALASNTQIAIPFPSNSYETYEASNMMNLLVYNDSNGNTAQCWLEGNTLNEEQDTGLYSSANLLYWCKIPDPVPAYSTDSNWYVGFVPNSIDLYGNAIAQMGAAPQLYCASGCPSTEYAGVDNGNTVFNFYDNFTGVYISPKWYTGNHNGGSITVDNGITIDGGSSSGQYYAISEQGGLGGSGPGWDATTNTFDFLGYFSTYSGRESNAGLWMPSGNPIYITTSGSAYELLVGGATSFSSGSTTSNNIFTAWVDSGTTYGTVNYGDEVTQGSVPSADGYPYLDAENDHGVGVDTYAQWYRIRTTPSGGVMPTVTLGAAT